MADWSYISDSKLAIELKEKLLCGHASKKPALQLSLKNKADSHETKK